MTGYEHPPPYGGLPGFPSRIGPYRILSRLGVGGMGEVFRAETAGGAPVCVKRALPSLSEDEEFVWQFVQEIELATRSRHPNVVEVLGHGEDAGQHYLVMELVEGADLDALFARRVRFSPGVVAYLGAELARALEYLHHRDRETGRAALVHCDVTPPNILIGKDGRVKLSDFGVAKALAGTGVATETGLRGRAGYFAPEQLMQQPIDSRVDLFVLGLVLWRALIGTHPYLEGRPRECTLEPWLEERTTSNLRRTVRDAAPAAPPGLQAAIEGALQLPAVRTPTPAHMLDALLPATTPGAASQLASLVEADERRRHRR